MTLAGRCIQLEICIQLGVGDVQPLAEHSRLQLFEVCGGILACCSLRCVAAFSLAALWAMWRHSRLEVYGVCVNKGQGRAAGG